MSTERLSSVAERLKYLRPTLPPHVKLLAVSKQVSTDKMREAYAEGIRDFGESRVQEAIAKQLELQDLQDITWHFIGRIQNNKARKVVEHFQWIHSVDSLNLAKRLDQIAEQMDRHPSTCLQLKLAPDPTKQGWNEADLWRDIPMLKQLQSLKIRGLMVIPPASLTDSELQVLFQRAQNVMNQIRQPCLLGLQFQELSMGMSSDYQLAIVNGSTIVRLGSILFGSRTAPNLGS